MAGCSSEVEGPPELDECSTVESSSVLARPPVTPPGDIAADASNEHKPLDVAPLLQTTREAEEAVRTSLNLRLIADAAAVPLAYCSAAEKRFLYLNSRYAERFGVTPAELQGKPVDTGITAEQYRLTRGYIERVLSGERVECELELPFPVDGTRYVRIKFTPEFSADGTVSGWVEAVVDITEQFQLAQRFRRSEERYRLLIEAGSTIVWSADGSGAFTVPQQSWELYTGQLPEQYVQRGWLDALQEQDRSELEEEFSAAISERRSFQTEVQLWHGPSGRYRYVELTAVPVVHEGESLSEWIGTMVDVDDRKSAEAALRESEARLRLAQQVARIGTFEWNIRENRQSWSPELLSLYGLTAEEYDGTFEGWIRRLHPQDAERVAETIGKALITGEYEGDYRVVCPDGSIRWLYARAQVIFDEMKRPFLMAGANVDITERKLAEEGLRDAARRKDEFLAMLAHELRNPLAPIRNSVQIMKLVGPSDPTMVAQRQMIERQVDHMKRLLDDLLDVSRITRGKIRLKKERIELRSVLSQALDAATPLIEAKSQQLVVQLPERPVMLQGDATRLAQVFINLLNNAAKYTDAGGWIELTTEELQGFVVIRVKDNGIGMTRETLQQAFELFAQGERGLDRSQGGLGIGLTLVKRLVEMHGGGVTAQSGGTGQGSEFRVTLPVLQTEVKLPTLPGEPRTVFPQIELRRVLVVDDNRDAADSLSTLLELLGHQVRTLYHGVPALEAALEFEPHLIFLDIGLPEKDGYEVAREIRSVEHLQQTTLVALTGYGQAEDRKIAFDAGFDRHMVKPVDPEALLRLLKEAAR